MLYHCYIIVIISCETTDHNTFIHLLQQLGSLRLTQLTIKDHGSNISLESILQACPQLTHLVYQPTIDAWKNYNILNVEPNTFASIAKQGQESSSTTSTSGTTKKYNANFGSLIYLHIDTVMDVDRRHLKSILQKSPNLRYFLGTEAGKFRLQTDDIYVTLSDSSWVKSDHLFKWCPKLTYFIGNGSYEDPNGELIERRIIRSTSDHEYDDMNEIREQEGIYHLAVSGDDDPNKNIPIILEKHQKTLQYLSIAAYDYYYEQSDWSSLFLSLCMPQLTTLICDNIEINPTALFTMISQCPTIGTLTWRSEDDLTELTDASLFTSLTTLLHLKILKLKGFAFLSETLSVMLARLPALEKLEIYDTRLMAPIQAPNIFSQCPLLNDLNLQNLYDDYIEVERPILSWAAFPKPLTSSLSTNREDRGPTFLLPNVESARLKSIPGVTYKLLISMCSNMPALKKLDVEIDSDALDLEEQQQPKDRTEGVYSFFKSLVETGWSIQELILRQFRDLELLRLALDSTLNDLPCFVHIGVDLPPTSMVSGSDKRREGNTMINEIDNAGLFDLLIIGGYNSRFFKMTFYNIITPNVPANILVNEILAEKSMLDYYTVTSVRSRHIRTRNAYLTDLVLEFSKD